VKSLKAVVVAGLALATVLAARAQISARAWFETYYLNPAPDELPVALRQLSREGFFEEPGRIALGIGFISAVFARHPARIDTWLRELGDLPEQHQRLLAAALWQAGDPLGADLLRKFGRTSSLREEIERLAATPSQLVIDTPVRSEASMNLQWGAFLASGDERHIVAILDAIGRNEPGLTNAARVSLAQNAAAHPRVFEICRAQLERQPEDVRGVLRAALQSAALAAPRS